MARYTKPDDVPRRKGSVGGSTFTRTANGFIIRRRYAGKQPRTIIQKANRNKFESTAGHYRTLNMVQVNSFAAAADLFPLVDSLGNTYYLSGQQHQNKINQNRQLVNLAPRNTGALPVSFPTFGITGGAANVSPFFLGITFTPSPIVSPYVLQVWATPRGAYDIVNFPWSKLRLLRTIQPGISSPQNVTANYLNAFGDQNPTQGEEIAVAVRMMDFQTGEKSDFSFLIFSLV